jgi:ketosteroid isomerase-like protein
LAHIGALVVGHRGYPAWREGLPEAFESADPPAWVEFYTEDAVFVGPGAPAIEGRSALLAVAPQLGLSVEIVPDSTLGTDDCGDAGTRELVQQCTRTGLPESSTTLPGRRFLMVWRREPDGRWRIARELLNEDI